MVSVAEWDRQFRLVRVHHEYREELGRLRLAGIGADAVAVAGQLGEALSSDLVGRRMIVMIFRTDGNDRYSMTKNKAIPIRELEEFCSQLSWIKPRVDVTHRWRFVSGLSPTASMAWQRPHFLEGWVARCF